MNYGLGRRPAPDPRDANYPLRAMLETPASEPALRSRRYWQSGPVLDQGQTPQCVGFAWRNWLNCAPIMDRPASGPAPDVLYREAQDVDEWPGNAYDGTSVRAGAKAMQAHGYLTSYVWSTSAEEVATFVLTRGPVVLGTEWRRGMFQPGPDGVVRVTAADPVVGGHAYLVLGYARTRGLFRCFNSWGLGWGQRGRFWLSGEDLQGLLTRDGEACAGLEQRVRP